KREVTIAPLTGGILKSHLLRRWSFTSHSGCYVLSLPRETFRWRSHFSLLVMVFCSHIDNNYFSETFR
ncbi:hypothetical protein FKL28_26960, partial [Klebsiella pneumoniae]|nr:hypothetical protein [Klebsiella pneumoniae]MBK2586364.1 hypothetical protein [Klebsiella pneumoniae]